MSSRAAGLTTTGGTLAVVRVVHGERDSFARSVDPAAKRHIVHHMRGGTLRRGRWGLVDAAYASETTPDGQCVSYVTFRLGGAS